MCLSLCGCIALLHSDCARSVPSFATFVGKMTFCLFSYQFLQSSSLCVPSNVACCLVVFYFVSWLFLLLCGGKKSVRTLINFTSARIQAHDETKAWKRLSLHSTSKSVMLSIRCLNEELKVRGSKSWLMTAVFVSRWKAYNLMLVTFSDLPPIEQHIRRCAAF